MSGNDGDRAIVLTVVNATEPPAGSPVRRLLRGVLRWGVRIGGAGVLVGLFVGCCVLSAPRYDGPVSEHFDGGSFHNSEPDQKGLFAFLRWRFTRHLGPWDAWTESSPGEPPPERVDGGRLRVTFVNHATALVQMDGLNVLTDPVWSERVSPVSFAGPRRRRAPGLRFEDLPPIDAVLVSHNHYDALDVITLRRLARDHGAPILTGLGNTAYLDQEEIAGGVDMDWWDTRELRRGVTVTAVPVRHFSGRGICDRNGTLWCGFVIEGPSGRVYFGGDSGYGAHFAEVRERLGAPRLALLPIGAYRPRWFMSPVHMDPEQAVAAAQDLGAATSVGVHFGTFPLADDGQREPVEELQRVLDALPVDRVRFWALDHGESREIPPADE